MEGFLSAPQIVHPLPLLPSAPPPFTAHSLSRPHARHPPFSPLAHSTRNSDWRARGHGEYREIPEEKQFFQEIKKTDRVVCHFYRDNWACKAIDHHLEVLCKQHLETKFLRINAEKSPFLTEKLKIWMLPTIALIKQEKTIGYIVGLDELGGNESFPTEWLAARLAQDKMIKWEAGDTYTTTAAPEAAVNIRKGGQARGGVERGSSDEDSDFDE